MLSIGISYVVIASIMLGENASEEMMCSNSIERVLPHSLIIMNKSQETTVFSGCQKLTSAMKAMPEK